jgi:hypothetical protein
LNLTGYKETIKEKDVIVNKTKKKEYSIKFRTLKKIKK